MTENVYGRPYPAGASYRLQALLDPICPNDGVSIGRWDDKDTWRLDAKPEAEEQQIEAAKQVMAMFDPWAEHAAHAQAMANSVFNGVPLEEVRAAYEESYTDESGSLDVRNSELAPDPVGVDHSEPADAGEEHAAGVDPSSPDEFSAEPLADDPGLSAEHQTEEVTPANFGGVLVSGDPLKAAQMEATWAVGEIEAAKVGKYDLPANASRLATLRGWSMAAKEQAAPDLTDPEKEELQALETFDGWLRTMRDHADELRNAIRMASSIAEVQAIDLQTGWPE